MSIPVCSIKKTDKNSEPWYLYIIENKFGHFYTGITSNWQRRFEEHKSNQSKTAKALKGKGPLTLKFCVIMTNRIEAAKAEFWLKKQSKNKKNQIVLGEVSLPFSHRLINHQLEYKTD